MSNVDQHWFETDHPARLWQPLERGVVQCHLSPRHCVLKTGQTGFCGVRKNIQGELRTLNYGKSVHATQEFVETEALFHFAPGSRILSMGNLGCMLNCLYCHNWRTSQARFVQDRDVRLYTPESVVKICLEKEIPIISWTYNDPVVWQEFVIDTAKLARQHGILNLYKSAFYISPEAVSELIDYMDVFSLSLKSMDPGFYRRLTQGSLEPVLEGIQQVFRSGKHLEVSNLMVTDANDSEEDAKKIADWMLTHCSDQTPLHFVRFHPDYKYVQVTRTPINRLARAREVAMTQGLKYVYMGNVFNEPGAHTYCPGCGQRVIARYGMNTRLEGLSSKGVCTTCGTQMRFSALDTSFKVRTPRRDASQGKRTGPVHTWSGDILSCHVETFNPTSVIQNISVQRQYGLGFNFRSGESIGIQPGESYRFVVSRSDPQESAIRLASDGDLEIKLFDLLDRAHFPTQEMVTLESHISPAARAVELPAAEFLI